ncbi:MAG: flagellar basal body-associated FliL family protein [Pacificibacter sp.]|uniref:flagellar basal body-associated FliL family protein n=1 Tax=Pacificibacter sp. TaxID=1917866 RepID=UPI00321B8EB9
MADEEQLEEVPKKKSKLPLILGVGLMLILGGGGFFAVYTGLLFAPAHAPAHDEQAAHVDEPMEPLPDVAYVPIAPLVINLVGTGSGSRHLRFQAQIEVPSAYSKEVEALLPRIVDVLNGYLRAVDVSELESPSALIRLRTQMLRRLQIVTGSGRVKDLLIMEFVIT